MHKLIFHVFGRGHKQGGANTLLEVLLVAVLVEILVPFMTSQRVSFPQNVCFITHKQRMDGLCFMGQMTDTH